MRGHCRRVKSERRAWPRLAVVPENPRHSEFIEYHTDWLKLVVKLDTKIFGNRQSRSKSKSHAKNPFIEDEAVNYGADDCEENEYESEPEVCTRVAPNKLPRNVSVSNRNPVSRLRRRSPPSSVYLKALLTVRLTLPTKKARLPKKNPATATSRVGLTTVQDGAGRRYGR